VDDVSEHNEATENKDGEIPVVAKMNVFEHRWLAAASFAQPVVVMMT
jgi:hypothetical protein